jgi:hypothetical protein
MSVCCEYYVSSSRGLCDWPIPRPEEFYRLGYVTVRSEAVVFRVGL